MGSRQQVGALVGGQREFEDALGFVESLVASGLARLALQGRDLPLHLAEDVAHSDQVLLGRGDLRLRLTAPRLVLADAGRFLDQDAPLFGLRRHDLRDASLLDDRVALHTDARIAEEVVDVLHPGGSLVEQILRLTRAIEPPCDLDLRVGGERGGRLAVAVVEGQHDLGHADRRAGIRPGKDHVVHALAAQASGRLLPHHPPDGVDHVGLAAAVGTDDRRDPVFEGEYGSIYEGFEAV